MDKRNYHSVGIVIDTEPERQSWCSTCMAIGKLSRLKQRIYLDDKGKLIQPQPPDADLYLQCWNCGLTIPTRDAKMLGKISGINGISPVENPNDIKKGKILGDDVRLSNRIKKLKRRQNKHPDPYVQRELDKGNLVLDYKTSMPT
ncbi:MAG TPA: hypothetical protein VF220_00135 [Nitrososphaeraceae archaeon]